MWMQCANPQCPFGRSFRAINTQQRYCLPECKHHAYRQRRKKQHDPTLHRPTYGSSDRGSQAEAEQRRAEMAVVPTTEKS